jgi:hypothetical protein
MNRKSIRTTTLISDTRNAKFIINLSVSTETHRDNFVFILHNIYFSNLKQIYRMLWTCVCVIHECVSLYAKEVDISAGTGSRYKRSPLICRLRGLCWTEIKFRATIVSTKRLPWLLCVLYVRLLCTRTS